MSVAVAYFTYPCQPAGGEILERGREQLLESLPKGRRAVHGSASSPRTVAATYQTHYPRNVRLHSQKNLSAPCALCGESVRHPHTGHVPCPDRHANVTPSPYAILSTFSTLRDLRALRGESSPLEHLPPRNGRYRPITIRGSREQGHEAKPAPSKSGLLLRLTR